MPRVASISQRRKVTLQAVPITAMPEPQTVETRRSLPRRVARWGALLFLCFLVYRVAAVYVVRPHACEPPPAPAQPLIEEVRDGRAAEYPARSGAIQLKAMSYNIQGHAVLLHPDHLGAVAEVIRKVAPDVVALQEVHDGTLQSRFENQLEELARDTGMTAAFGTSMRSYGGRYGNAILTRGTITGSRVHRLPGRGEPRSLHETTVLFDGQPVNIYVTHLASWGRLQRSSRSSQIACIVEIIRRSPHPFILMGDFNTTPGNPEIAPLTEGPLVRHSVNPSKPTHILTQQHIDYIFPDAGWDTVSADVVQEGPSDHWPITATLISGTR